MENQQEKVSLRRRTIIFAALGMILVVLPAISYFYLKSGLDWHLQAKADLKDYGKIRGEYIIFPDGEKQNQLKGKVVVIHIFGQNPVLNDTNKLILDTGQRLYERFGKNYDFRLTMVSQGSDADFKSYAQTLPSAEMATWVWSGAMGSWRTIIENGYEKFCVERKEKAVPKYFALCDTSGTIRHFYNAMDEKQVGRMVEMITLLVPKESIIPDSNN